MHTLTPTECYNLAGSRGPTEALQLGADKICEQECLSHPPLKSTDTEQKSNAELQRCFPFQFTKPQNNIIVGLKNK